MDGTVFKNLDVYEQIPNNLFHDSTSFTNCLRKDCRGIWFSTPPKHTIFRVNLLVTTVEKVAEIIDDFLAKESEKRGLGVPISYRHPQLPDCLVVPPWPLAHYAPLHRHDQEVVVDAACGAAVLRGANVFAPGVMGMLPSIQAGDLVSVYADSAGRCKRGLTVTFTDPGKLFVGNGEVKMSRKCLFQKDLHPKGVAVEILQPASGVAAVNIPQHLGLLQNLPSIVCGHVVSPQPGDKVIDLCAAPGHKTTHLAALMENQGVLVALDRTTKKIEGLLSLCRSMHIDCVKAFAYDSTKAVSLTPGPDWAPPFAPSTFDHVLLDAPCSALGQRPQIGCKTTSKQVASYPKLQKKLFTTAVQLVRPGGSLVYSTCSLTTAENEDMVTWALDTFPHLELVPALPLLGRPGNSLSHLSEDQCRMVQRFGPPLGPRPEEDTIGFFIAKFSKVR